MKLSEFLIAISDKALYKPKRFLQPGHNGPYNDSETKVRNYGHWLITFSKCFELTGRKIYLEKVQELAEYLISDHARPYGFSFHHRSKEGKDRCNGLVGQAWTFESLACASSILDDIKYVKLAEEVFFQHNFNKNLGLWNRLEIDGQILSVDDAFNHQLWFASCATLMNTSKQDEINDRIFQFMNFLSENLSVLNNGLIYHQIERDLSKKSLKLYTKYKLKSIIGKLFGLSSEQKVHYGNMNSEFTEAMIYKSIGYHQFNMYAFAILKESLPDHPFWSLEKCSKSLNYLVSDDFKNKLSNNKYGYPYNSPGFEVPYVLSVFCNLDVNELVDISTLWINEQFKRCYNSKTEMMDKNTDDYLTNTSRIYEITRFPIHFMDKIKIQTKYLGNF